MHFMSDRPAAEGHARRPDQESTAARDESRDRQDAALFLEAAAKTEDQAARQSLRRRAADLLSLRRPR